MTPYPNLVTSCGRTRQETSYHKILLTKPPSKTISGVLTIAEVVVALRPYKKDGKTIFPKEYSAWTNMRARCNNPDHPWFYRYGQRGISICDEWNDFDVFYDWCHENGINDGLTLDRIDNDRSYCPENCRWVNSSEQRRNQSNVRWITFEGESMIQTDWARRIGVSDGALHYRIKKWGLRKALTTPNNRELNRP